MTDPLTADLCAWHKHEEKLDVECEPGCPNCGRLLEWKTCEGCHADFLDWSVHTFDDTISGPAATGDGDLVCIPCAGRWQADERAEEEAEAARDGDWRGYYP